MTKRQAKVRRVASATRAAQGLLAATPRTVSSLTTVQNAQAHPGTFTQEFTVPDRLSFSQLLTEITETRQNLPVFRSRPELGEDQVPP